MANSFDETGKPRPGGSAKGSPRRGGYNVGLANSTPLGSTRAADVAARAKAGIAAAKARGVQLGRPGLYTPDMCDAVVAFAATTGMSLSAFCGSIGLDRSAMNKWAAAHPEFAEALDQAAAARALYLESAAERDILPARISYRLRALQNCAASDWREVKNIELSGGAAPLKVLNVTPAEAYAQMVREADGE